MLAEFSSFTILAAIAIFWIIITVLVMLFKKALLHSTWNEPYIAAPVVVIESDDWGPGTANHAEALTNIVRILKRHHDAAGRAAVFTANIVLSVPNTVSIRESDFKQYTRIPLDECSPEMTAVLGQYISQGLVVPQLHGLEHFNPDILMRLANNGNEAVRNLLVKNGWMSWEDLEICLQRHYLNRNDSFIGSITKKHSEVVKEAVLLFKRIFKEDSLSTAAPCYFWTDETEEAFRQNGIKYIQTEGYRYIGGFEKEQMRQDPKVIRFGTKNKLGQIYLVRNVMHEPAHGRTFEDCRRQLIRVFRQALPATICTHRYNYTDERFSQAAFKGLEDLLAQIERKYPERRYLSSPELGEFLEHGNIYNRFSENGRAKLPGIKMCSTTEKISAFLYRLWYRHKKIRLIALCTGLIAPVFVLIIFSGFIKKCRLIK